MTAGPKACALVLRLGTDRRRFLLAPGGRSVLIGRSLDAQLVLPTTLVSRRHCEVRLTAGGLELHDLGSANGTFLNGKRVEAAHLASGDVVRAGDQDIAVEVEASPAAWSCERCGRLVSMTTLEDGLAFELGERILCSGCRTGGHLQSPEVERRMTEALEAEGFTVLARISPRSWCPVFKARRRDLDDVVALKVLPIVEGLPEKKLERFKTEARVMAQLKHPNVVPIYEVRHRPALSLLVMEFVAGETLRERIERRGRIRIDEALRLMTGLASALEAAGKLGVVHRNVKPSNVLLARGSGEARLIDFGLARNLRAERGPALTDSSLLPLGTLRYMAPEQMRDSHDADARADIYALAATVFHALTGKPPHHDRNELELLQSALDGQPLRFDLSREAEIPQAMKNVLACALMQDPADRHPSATVLLDELRQAASQMPGASEEVAPRHRKTSATIRMPRFESGAFANDELLDLARKLGDDARTGRLEVKSGVRGGSLVFEEGQIVAARTLGGQRGEEAAQQILGLVRGEWVFKPGTGPDARPEISAGTHGLLLEAKRRRSLFETEHD